MDNKNLNGTLVDPLFDEKIRVVEEARKKGEDPAKAVEKYMKTLNKTH